MRAQQLLLGELHDHLVGALLYLRRAPAGWRRLVRFAGPGRLLLPLPPHLQLRDLELLRDLTRAHPDRRQAGEPRGDGAVGNPLRLELLLDVALQADFPDRRHVAGARTEAHPVEDVDDGFVVGGKRGRA